MPAFSEPAPRVSRRQTGKRLRRPGRRRGDVAPTWRHGARRSQTGTGRRLRARAAEGRRAINVIAEASAGPLSGAGQAGTHRCRGRPRPPLESRRCARRPSRGRKPSAIRPRAPRHAGPQHDRLDCGMHIEVRSPGRDPRAMPGGSRPGSLTGCGMPDQPVHRRTPQSAARSVPATGSKAARRWRRRIPRGRGRRAARRPPWLA